MKIKRNLKSFVFFSPETRKNISLFEQQLDKRFAERINPNCKTSFEKNGYLFIISHDDIDVEDVREVWRCVIRKNDFFVKGVILNL